MANEIPHLSRDSSALSASQSEYEGGPVEQPVPVREQKRQPPETESASASAYRSVAMPKICMYLSPSKYWWVYLGLRSNPALAASLNCRYDRALFFDDLSQLAGLQATAGSHIQQIFFVFWDGVTDPTTLDKAALIFGPEADLTAVVVGDSSLVSPQYKVENLYADGSLAFNVSSLRFDCRTTKILFVSALKTWLMPLKNILKNPGSKSQALGLLLGKRRIVFCGSYGTIPKVMAALCERHSVDFRLFDQYPFYWNEPTPSFATYRQYVRNDGFYLADLYDRSQIDATFFLSATHLLGREYFIEKVRASSLDLFANGYGTGININVYTTPFYKQHVFLDFGSVVGTGNYPRLVDLQYFKKKYVEIKLNDDVATLAALARTGTIEQHYEQQWQRKGPELMRLMKRSIREKKEE